MSSQAKGGVRGATQHTFLLLHLLALPSVRFLRVADSVGHAAVKSLDWPVAILVAVLWAALGRSEAMWWAVAVFALSYIEYRIKSRRNPDAHSYAHGTSQFQRWCRNPVLCLRLEAGLMLLVGWLLLRVDAPAGAYFLCAGGSHFLITSFLKARQERMDDDINDARLSQMATAERLRERAGWR
ncbi:MAG TPA: hypothetical protein VD866_23630 [Urbifossiella sp.]|nr:hypothetical protein [Urbifossiella sp.]